MLNWAIVAFMVGIGSGQAEIFTPDQRNFIAQFSALVMAAITLTWLLIFTVRGIYIIGFTDEVDRMLLKVFSYLFPERTNKMLQDEAIRKLKSHIFRQFYTADELSTRATMNIALMIAILTVSILALRLSLLWMLGYTGSVWDILLTGLASGTFVLAFRVKEHFTDRMRAKYKERYETQYEEITRGEGRNKITAILIRRDSTLPPEAYAR